MKIGIDMDGVIVDTINFISKELSVTFGNLVTPGDIAHRLAEIEGIDEVFRERGEHLLCSLPPMNKAADIINSLGREHDIYIISARFSMHYEATLKWLEEYGIGVNEVIFTNGAGKADICTRYGIELLVEDSLSNAIEVSAAGIRVLLLSTSYNRTSETCSIDYCDNWDEIYQYISQVFLPAKFAGR